MANLNSHDLLFLDSPEFSGFGEKIEQDYDLDIKSTSLPEIISFTSKKLILHTSKGDFFLKEKPQYCSNELALKRSAHFQDYVSSRMEIVPKILSTRTKDYYIYWSGRYYFLADYKKGRHYNGSPKDIGAMIDGLNAFQKIGNDYLSIYKDSRQEELTHHESPDVSSGIIDVQKKIKTENDGLVFQEIISLYENLCSEYATFTKEKYTMAHSDFILFNLILDESGVVAINDFDNVKVLPRIHDMAEFLVSATLLNYIAPITNLKLPIQINPEAVLFKYILERYISDFKLSDAEKKLLGTVTEIIWLWSIVLAVFKEDYSLSDLKPAIEALRQRKVKTQIDHFCYNYHHDK